MIEKSIADNRNLGWASRKEKSHGPAWQAAKGNKAMKMIDIAKEGGAGKEMLSYIGQVEEYKSYFL